VSEFLHPAIVLAQASVTGASISAISASLAGGFPYITGYSIELVGKNGATPAAFKVSTAGWGDTDFTIPIIAQSSTQMIMFGQNFIYPVRGKTPGGTVALQSASPGASYGLNLQIFGYFAP